MIIKHEWKVTMFSDGPLEPGDWELPDIYEAITTGDCIGKVVYEYCGLVPPETVHDELVAIGNDGTFFDLYPGDEE